MICSFFKFLLTREFFLVLKVEDFLDMVGLSGSEVSIRMVPGYTLFSFPFFFFPLDPQIIKKLLQFV